MVKNAEKWGVLDPGFLEKGVFFWYNGQGLQQE